MKRGVKHGDGVMSGRSERLQKLEERQRRLQVEIQRERAMEAQQERKRDARRKIVVGAMVLGWVERGEWPQERLLEKLDAYLTRDHDRALFDLARRSDANAASTDEAKAAPVRATG
jgi:hypothetical protein